MHIAVVLTPPAVCGVPRAGTGNSKDACTACQPGTWSAGTDTEACRSCGWGFTSPTAATRADQCVAVHACPEGQVAPPGAVSGEQCACKPGFGGAMPVPHRRLLALRTQ
jgi:hypothetical protein